MYYLFGGMMGRLMIILIFSTVMLIVFLSEMKMAHKPFFGEAGHLYNRITQSYQLWYTLYQCIL